MAFNGSGVFVRLYNWVNDAAANIKIRADRFDNELNGMATGLSTCITKDGQTTITANLPMAGYKHTGVGAASSGTDYARADQLLASTYCGTSSGTNTVTATVPIGGSFNAAGKIVSFKAGGTNTGATTFNGVTVQKLGQALEAGDITTGDIVVLEHDGTNAQMVSPARFPVLGNYSIKGLTLDKTVFSALTNVAPALDDTVPFGDTSDFGAIRKTTWNDVISLAPSPTIPILRNYVDGFTMSTAGSSSTMTIGAGQASDSTNAAYISLAASIGKTTSSWVVGTGNGGLDTGSIANSTWYHFYAIRRPDTGVVDVVFSTSASSPTLPTNYTQFRRIGSGLTNGSAQWAKFIQVGNNFTWDAAVLDIADGSSGTSAKTGTLPSVPLGLAVIAKLQASVASNNNVYFSALSVSDQAPSLTATPLAFFSSDSGSGAAGNKEVITNTAQAFRYRTSSNDTLRIATLGWMDFRGQE